MFKQKRNIIICAGVLFFCSIFLCGYSAMQWPVFFSTPLKQEIARQLSRALNREVTVGNVKGGLLYQTTLSDIKIAKEKKLKDGTLATIDSATITYHPLKFILNRANILPAISRIEVSGLHANVIREKDGQLNVARLLSAADPAHPPGYFPFRAKVTVKNGTIDFADLAGIFPRPLTPPFKCQFTDLAANLDFRTKGRLTFSSSGIILQNGAANPVACLGEVNLKNTKSKFTIQAQNLELKTWFDYVIPQIGIQAETGRADVNLVLSTQPDNPTHPVAAEGEAQISQAQLLLPGHRINNINGAVAFTSDQVTLKKVRVAYEKIPALVSGRIFNFENPQLDLTITSPSNFNWSTLPASFNFLRASKLSGTGSYIISATGPVPHPVLSGKFEVLAGKIFGYACYGNALLSGNENALLFNVNTLNLCGGALSGPVYYSLNQKNPEIKSTVALRGLNLAELANETPGVSGRIYGKAEISGTLDNLNGEIAANLFEAELLGQPIDAVAATFNSRGGETTLHKFELSSKQASLESHGTVAKDLKFSLFADCRNVKLKGEGPLGPMAADLQKFTGAFSGQFNDELLAHPLLNLNCSGEVFLKNGAIGQQSIGLAQSQFKLEDGRLTVDEFSATSGKTTVRANGCVGGKDTSLLITAKNASFSDLTILNQFLPDKFDHPTGRADLTISVSGNLPQNLKFDSWLFLGDLNYDVDCTLHNAKFYHTFFQNFMLNFSWRDHLLSTLDADFKTRTSTLRARLSRAPAQIQLDAHGYLDLDEFQFLLFRFGKLGGQVNFNLAATEAPNNPLFKIKVAANNFIYNSIQLDKFNGEFQLDQNTLSTIQPVAAKIKGNQYTIDGQINFRTAAGGQWLPDSSDLTIHLSNADLGGIYAITQNILAETSRFIISPTILGKTIHSRSMLNFSTPDPQKFQRGDEVIFYLLNDKGALIYGFLKNFALYNRLTAKDESQNHRQFDFASNLSGKTNGDVEVTGPFTKIKVETDNLVVENGRFFEFNFDRLDFQGRYYDREISLDNCKIQKDYGNFNVAGKININTADLNLSLSASRFPTDALRLIFPGDKTFGGKLNLAATIAGKLQNPKISAEASAPNLNIQGINFQDMTVDLDLIDKVLFINNLSFSSQGKDSQISGYFPLSQNGKINLAATLEGEALGLINLLTNEIQWIEGRAKAQVAISGTRSNLDVDGEISLEKARIYVNALQSSLKEVTGQLVIHNSKGDLSNLAAVWEGVRTKDVRNQLSLSGTLNVKDLLAEEANVAVDLTLADTALTADLPDLISGTITLQDINLHGPFYFSGTQSRKIGPTLSGKAKIEDGTLYLPKGETKDKKILFLDYDLTLSLGKNTYAVGGDVSNVINPLLVNLQIQGDNLVLKGNSMKPSLLGEINFLQGTINLFDRELSLLPPSQQEKYFVAQREKINDNKAVFNDGNGETAILPELNLTAKVVVENYTENADATYTKEKITILTQLTGQPYVKDEAKGIKTTFYSFREEPGGTNIQAASFTQDEIRVMLLPDFLKSALGLSRASSNVEATALAAEYLQGRFQSYLSATISRQIERSLELENMTLEYNLGRDLRRISGASSTNNDTEEKLWALGFTKGFFDKFFIDWHYSAALDNSTQAQKTYFNYELSYKISGIWSIAYFQEPNNVMDPLSGQSKTTLRAKLRF